MNDFCFARKTEREELVDYLSKNGGSTAPSNQSSTAAKPSSAPPAAQQPPPQPNPYQTPPNMPFAQPTHQPYPTQPYPAMPYYGPYSNMGNPYYPPPPQAGYYPGIFINDLNQLKCFSN